eukprot:TRINITY_DN14242_c0_g1_i6.p1 TRINITY_DN14242_c0_g1~~TRINITY_DN14242_c0_g1_i6.p1  ORF type:complete len:303 (+),score=43.78 TRINITY_DN14242_c0_g1_i6:623-1531(+)
MKWISVWWTLRRTILRGPDLRTSGSAIFPLRISGNLPLVCVFSQLARIDRSLEESKEGILPEVKLLEDELKELEEERARLKEKTLALETSKENAEERYNALCTNYQQLLIDSNEILNELHTTLTNKRTEMEEGRNKWTMKNSLNANKQRQEQLSLLLNSLQTEIDNLVRQHESLKLNINSHKDQVNAMSSPRTITVPEFTVSSKKGDFIQKTNESYKNADDAANEEDFSFEKSEVEDESKNMVKWYEDSNVLISSSCSIDIPTKKVSFKVVLENKQQKKNLTIKCFEPSITDSTCNLFENKE